MRILFLSQLLPYPPNAGPKVRSYNLLRYLAQKHQVTLMAFTRPDDSPEAIDHLRGFCEVVVTTPMRRSRLMDLLALSVSLVSGKSFIIRRDFIPAAARELADLCTSAPVPFDAVHADQLWMAQYALYLKKRVPGLKLVLDEHNACFQVFQRLAQRAKNPVMKLLLEREWRSLYRYEAGACAQFDQVITVTEEDRKILSKMAGRFLSTQRASHRQPSFSTIPICGDTSQTLPVIPTKEPRDVLYLGTMFWLPNIEGVLWFAREVWPRVAAQVPGVTFSIAGKNPPKEVQKLASDASAHGSIHVLGYVSDPEPYLEKAGVFIVPLLSGGGMRVKIIDGWCRGLPIISTSIGAEGIQYLNGENILIADGAEAFAQAVIKVFTQPELAQRLRQNGRLWVENQYDWQKIYPQWDNVYPPSDQTKFQKSGMNFP